MGVWSYGVYNLGHILGISLLFGSIVVLELMPAWRHRQAREPSRREQILLAVAGGASLLCWLTAIAAGRMIGYW